MDSIDALRRAATVAHRPGYFITPKQLVVVNIVLRSYTNSREERLALVVELFRMYDEDVQLHAWGEPGDLQSTKDIPLGYASAFIDWAYGGQPPGGEVTEEADAALRRLVSEIRQKAGGWK